MRIFDILESVRPMPAYEGIIRLVLACVLGGVLGLEREFRKHPAGLRTHILVALGSAGLTLFGFVMMSKSGSTNPFAASRIIQGIITGMGFIGAGAIMKEGGSIHGITTAASLWVASAIGILVASGEIMLAATMTLFALLTLIFSHSGSSNGAGEDEKTKPEKSSDS